MRQLGGAFAEPPLDRFAAPLLSCAVGAAGDATDRDLAAVRSVLQPYLTGRTAAYVRRCRLTGLRSGPGPTPDHPMSRRGRPSEDPGDDGGAADGVDAAHTRAGTET
ncbi:hypothetical protein L083_4194 [Actinoplanes sp. N902-109]|nr:hypothetical protein L083_4194 [Actinoplanes sp. N902-109]